jgi:polyribonucleotide nucleotidyltransferase
VIPADRLRLTDPTSGSCAVRMHRHSKRLVNMSHVIVEREIGGRAFRLETGKYAKQADAAVFATFADTSVISAVVRGEPRPGIDFFPLQIDYRERTSAAGKFPGGFRKREGAPNTKEILTMRMIDRPLRPLFAKGLYDEVVIQNWVESADGQNDPDVVAGTAAAAAVAISSIPHDGPVATVRVGRIDGKFVIFPTLAQMDYSEMDLVLSGHREGVNMIEVGSSELSEQVVLEAIEFGHQQIQILLDMIDELVEKAGQAKAANLDVVPDEVLAAARKALAEPLARAKQTEGKLARDEAVKQVVDAYVDRVAPEPTPEENLGVAAHNQRLAQRKHAKQACETIEEEVVRKSILDGRRSDGRGAEEIRPLECEVGVLRRAHGSAVFTRGETQAMVSATLGVGKDEQIVDGLAEEYSQKFMLHYNFPPFCVGEARRITGPSRREVGHGALAERSLSGLLPAVQDFPYTVRLVCEILESNGSSSMASVCGGCLALMDAGVPIANTCAGISVGLVEEDGRQLLLTDIMGEEDHFGDMDFKVAGTRRGITGIQLDLKTRGLGLDVIRRTFEQAREGRMVIIEAIEKAIERPRDTISPYAPRLLTMKIDPEKIGKLIGPGGKTIRAIQDETGATIEVEEDGTVFISAVGEGKAQTAMGEVEKYTAEVQVGKIYTGRVNTVKDFGAFVEVIPGQDGLCHISELADGYVEKVGDVVKIGDQIKVKVINKDEQGRLKLSRKAVLKEEAKQQETAGAEA